MPASVDGSKLSRPKESTCCRFSLVSTPSRSLSLRTSTLAAETHRLRAVYCETPRCVSVYLCPNGDSSEAVSPGLSEASISVLNAIPENATKYVTIPRWTM